MIASNSNPAAQEMFVTTLLETGQLKFLANMFASQEDIDRIVNANKSDTIDADVDTSLIDIKGATGNVDISGGKTPTDVSDEPIVIEEIAGASYHATMMIVKDPSRVSVATIYPWREEGETLDQIANSCGAIGAINGGIYNSYNNSGGMPYGVVVSNHEIQYNRPEDFEGLYLIGLTDGNILEVIDINGWSAAQVENIINEKKIRDAVTFQEEATDSNNHFVQLIINGEKRDLNGKAGSGLNPRTAIGQRADGTILMLVTDGRGKAGHLGASAADLIEIMDKYGAVNAVNLDGGSSSCMYYNGDYLMTSVTFYYTNASWKLPLAFVVK
ncbi:MAG: phosphodiester glycosidase family protein [Clostridia bacterium]|nr:phosphodiester glycosidase family protein [Clostridia bacterium]